jgi:23S rRNA pseudouridine2605 synthase
MNNRTPKKSYGRKPERSNNGAKNSRFAKKDSGNRPYARKPRRDDDADERPRYRKNEEAGARPRYRKNDDEKRPSRFSRDKSEKPYRSRPRRDDGTDARPRYRKNDDTDTRPRYRKNDDADARPRYRKNDDTDARPRYRKNDDAGARPRYRRNDDDKRPSRFSRDKSEKPYRSRPRRDDDFDKKPRFRRNDDRRFDKPERKTYAAKPKAEKNTKTEVENLTGEVRINKFIANSGICSRREADSYITAGLVSINGQVVTEVGVKVKPGDDVRFNGERLKGEMKVYIVLNKPKDFVTTTDDPHADKTVLDLIGEKCTQRVFPVGRLDKNTTGVLLLTNDGDLCERLTHPSYNKKKIYHVHLNRNVKVSDLRKLIDGIELEDGLAKADEVAYVDGEKSEVGVEIHSGRNRVVRRMFEALNFQVKALDRVYFAGLTKKNLKRGQWRFLTEQEINTLRMGAYE